MTFTEAFNRLADGYCARRPMWKTYFAREDEKDENGEPTGRYTLRVVCKGKEIGSYPLVDDQIVRRIRENAERSGEDLAPVPAAEEASEGSASGKSVKSDGETPIKFSSKLILSVISDDWGVEKTENVESQQKESGSDI